MSKRGWHRWHYSSGGSPVTEFHDDQGFTINTGAPFGDYVTVLRTRLQVWAWWNSNLYPLPGPAQRGYPLKTKMQFNFAETGSNPPPTGWPGDPAEYGVERIQPTIYSALSLRAQLYQADNGGDPVLPVYFGWAELDPVNGDSKGQRRFDGTYVIAGWLAISGAGFDWESSFPEATDIPFYFRALASVLVESPSA